MQADILILTHFNSRYLRNFPNDFFRTDSKFEKLCIAFDNMILNYNTANEYSSIIKSLNYLYNNTSLLSDRSFLKEPSKIIFNQIF